MAVLWEGGEVKRTSSKKRFIGNWVSSTAPSPPAPQHLVKWVMLLSFGWPPCSPHPENAWGLFSKPTQMQHNWQGCYVQLKVKEKKEGRQGRGKKKGKISPLLKTWGEWQRETHWQVPLQIQPKQRKHTLSSYLWEFSHKSNSHQNPF